MPQGPPLPSNYVSVPDYIREESKKAGIPDWLALAVAEQESSFNPTAIGPTLDSGESAIGTFQLLPSTAKRFVVDPHDPIQNIQGGTKYLRELMDRHSGNIDAVLKEYGGVKQDTTYVPGVLSRIGKFQGAPPPASPSRATPTITSPTGPPEPRGRSAMYRSMMQGIISSIDPRTPQGRQNIAGTIGAIGATALAPELAVPGWLYRLATAGVPVVGAFAGGTAENVGEQAYERAKADLSGAPPTPFSGRAALAAGGTQAAYETVGQGTAAVVKGMARRIGASGVSKRISQGLSDAQDAVNARLTMQRPTVSPGKAGQLVEGVVQGPSKAYKDVLGEEVGRTAETGPAVATAPLKTQLADLAAQITPMASHAQPTVTVGGQALQPAMAKKLIATTGLSVLPPDHPLPALLDQIRTDLADFDEIPFAEAHKIKTLLDSAVNWDRGAKKPAEQITKGFRQALRSEMAGHQPYEEATAKYGPVAKLYRDFGADKLAAHIRSNPGEVVQRIKWQNPDGVRLLRDITSLGGQTSQGAQIAGDTAFDAVRKAWTNEQLIALGPKRMAKTIRNIEASNAGQEFVQQMYGDAAGQLQWQNLKDIAAAFEHVQSETKRFAATPLSRATHPAGVVRDIGLAGLPGHQIGKIGAISRLVFGEGTSANSMLEWASRTPESTQWLIRHILSGSDMGIIFADLARMGAGALQPMASHDQGPPRPTALSR